MRYKVVINLLAFIGCGLFVASAAQADFRCGSNNTIISVGADESTVRQLCGEPTAQSHWEETYYSGSGLAATGKGPDFTTFTSTPSASITVQRERWTYNRGSSQFIQYLIFKNGLLDEIKSGNYGS